MIIYFFKVISLYGLIIWGLWDGRFENRIVLEILGYMVRVVICRFCIRFFNVSYYVKFF